MKKEEDLEVTIGSRRRRRREGRKVHSLEETKRDGDIDIVGVVGQDGHLDTIQSLGPGLFYQLRDVNFVLVDQMRGRL